MLTAHRIEVMCSDNVLCIRLTTNGSTNPICPCGTEICSKASLIYITVMEHSMKQRKRLHISWAFFDVK